MKGFIKKTAIILLAAGLLLAVKPWDIWAVTKPAVVTKLAVGTKSASLYVGQKYAIKAAVTPKKSAVRYATSNKRVATVSTTGVVKAVAAGSTSITIKSGAKTQKVTIKVKKPVAVTKVTFPKPVASMAVGEQVSLFVVLQPSNATFKTLTWTSSNKKILSVTEAGTITALSEGTASVTAKAASGKYAVLAIKVQKESSPPAPIESIAFASESLTVATAQSVVLAPKIAPSNAAAKELRWDSDNSKAVKVDQAGRITGVSLGSAVITASSISDPSKRASVTITVKSVYRALLIGNEYVASGNRLYGPFNDAAMIRDTLGSTSNGANFDTPFEKNNIVIKKDATKQQVLNAISSTFASATENDVSYFYFSGHGASGKSTVYIALTDGYISADELASHLGAVPGKIVVMLDSCYSGGFISRGASVSDEDELQMLNENVIKAFEPKVQFTARGDLTTVNGKFYVLTASARDQTSLSFYSASNPTGNSYGLFTKLLTQAASGDPAEGDANGDNRVSVSEAAQYIMGQIQAKYAYVLPRNNVQFYPPNSAFPVFSIK